MPMSRCASADSPAPKTTFTYFCPSMISFSVEQRRPEQVGIRGVVAEQLRARLQQRDDLAVLPGLQVAVGEHEIGIACVGRRRHDAPELGDRLLRPRRLVVGERQVQADGGAGRIDLQRQHGTARSRRRTVRAGRRRRQGSRARRRARARWRAPPCRSRWRRGYRRPDAARSRARAAARRPARSERWPAARGRQPEARAGEPGRSMEGAG